MQGLIDSYKRKLEMKEKTLSKMQANQYNYSDMDHHIKCIKIEIRMYKRFIKDLEEMEV